MKNFTTCICILGLSGTAFGTVMIDQIGPDDGSGIDGGITGCQDFESAYDIYDIATLDNFTAAGGENIATVEMCLNGWNGFVDPSSVMGYTANLYSDPAVAAGDLMGDIGSSYADAADTTQSATWTGAGYVISMPSVMVAAAGTNWVSMIPTNDFATGGQTGVAGSVIGDGTLGWQANPGGGFGMPGNMQEMAGEAAYRVSDGAPPDPCNEALPMPCPADVNQDGSVSVGDVLDVIGTWGTCGDGTFRPLGDVAPGPNGDCCVDVSDVLAVVGAFGGDCSVLGGCCAPDGTCSVQGQADCDAAGGIYFGDNTTCDDGGCIPQFGGCPDGADMNCDPCFVDGDDGAVDCNGGLNVDPPMFQAIATGTAMCGTTSVYLDGPTGGTYRDLDWFSNSDLNAGGVFTISAGTSGADLLFGIVDAGTGAGIELWVMPGGYESSVTFAPLIPGNYAVLVAVNDWNTAWTCGSGAEDYSVLLTQEASPNGACCMPDESCQDLDVVGCYNAGGSFDGSQDCSTADCAIVGGDLCSSPLMAVDGANPFDTTDMTAGEIPDFTVCADSFPGWATPVNDVWFEWTAGASDNYIIDTCDAASHDTTLVVYDACGGSVIACNGDALDSTGCQIYHSELTLAATAGQTYMILIGGYSAADVGPGTLNINIIPPPMPGACCMPDFSCLDNLDSDQCASFGGSFAGENSTCADPDICSAAPGDECSSALAASDGGNAFDTNGMSASDPQPDDTMCAGTYLDWDFSPDVWLEYVATGGLTTFDTCGTADYDTSIVLYEGCDTQVACNGDGAGCAGYTSSMEYNCTAGQTYYIRIGGWQGAVGTGTLNITP